MLETPVIWKLKMDKILVNSGNNDHDNGRSPGKTWGRSGALIRPLSCWIPQGEKK